MNIDRLEQLKGEWFDRFDRILNPEGTIPSSNLKCLEMCQARCCPRPEMRQMQPGEIASPVVVLLPFEMEYIVERTGVSTGLFRRWSIPLDSETSMEIGMLDLGKPCPFLKANRQCGIHYHNPLDCRTFPMLPGLNHRDELEWHLGENCPSLAHLNPLFKEYVQRCWESLLPALPRAWWDLYAFADHWTGWTAGSEGADAA